MNTVARPLARLAILVAAALAVTGTVGSARQDLAPNPTRIISLVPAVTEAIFALGAGDRMIAVSSFDHFPPEVERLARVGALLDPDVERILSLRPGMVVVYRSQKDVIAQLTRAKIPTFVYTHAGLADVSRTIQELGDRLGTRDNAARLTADITSRIAAVRARVAVKPRPRTLVVLGREPLSLRGIYASGGVGFIHDMLVAAGGENIFANVERESLQATTELILANRPEVIIELNAAPDASAQSRERNTWAALSSLPAVRNNRVHLVSDPRTVVPGPRVAEGVEMLAEILAGRRAGQ
jgi:iron complex transport system substrate-binding protein